MAKELVLNFKITGTQSISQLKNDLKAAKDELAALEPGSEAFNVAAEKAGALKDQLDDVNESVKELSTGSGLEKFGNVLGSLKNKILSLDFKGASEKAQQLAEIAKSMTFAQALGGIKQLGTALVNLGKALLTNPIFLLAAAVTAIGFAIYALVTAETDAEQSARELNEATQELAITTENYNKQLDIQSERTQIVYDTQIKLAQIAGAKQSEIIKLQMQAASDQNKINEEQLASTETLLLQQSEAIDALKSTGAEQEEIDKAIKAHNETADKTNELLTNKIKLEGELTVLSAQRTQAEKDEGDKALADEDKKLKDSIKLWKEYAAARVQIARQIRDLQISLIEDENEREIAQINEKYNRLIEDTKKNEKILQSERDQIILLAEQNRTQDLLELEAARDQALLDAVEQRRLAAEKIKEEQEDADFEAWKKEKEEQKKRDEEELAAEKEKAENKKKIQEQYAAAVLSITSSIFEISNNLGKQDEKSQLARAKRQFQIKKVLDVSEAGINTAKAITKAIAEFGPPPSPLGIAGIVSASAIGAAQIAAILSKKFEGGGSSASSSAGGSTGGGASAGSSFTPTAFTPNQFATGQSNVTTVTSQSQQNVQAIRAYVVETEITTAQNRINNFQQESVI